ncbi:toll/interleukin-1 receptor domain-containing protein [Nocardioides sp. AN3]
MELFLSHATRDEQLVAEVVSRLDAAGVQTYLAERDGRAGTNVHSKIEAAIRRSDLVIALLTEAGGSSSYVHQEIGYARRAGKLIIPVVTAGMADHGLGMLEGTEYIVVDEAVPSAAILQLSERVTQLAQAKSRRDQLDAALLIVALGIVILTVLDD